VAAELQPVQGELGGSGNRLTSRDCGQDHRPARRAVHRYSAHHRGSDGEVSAGFRDFNLDCRNIRLQPVARDILIQHLLDQSRYRLVSGMAASRKTAWRTTRPWLIDFNDVSYDDHAELLYKLAGQVWRICSPTFPAKTT